MLLVLLATSPDVFLGGEAHELAYLVSTTTEALLSDRIHECASWGNCLRHQDLNRDQILKRRQLREGLTLIVMMTRMRAVGISTLTLMLFIHFKARSMA